jgi:hypothetical protein
MPKTRYCCVRNLSILILIHVHADGSYPVHAKIANNSVAVQRFSHLMHIMPSNDSPEITSGTVTMGNSIPVSTPHNVRINPSF